MRKILIANRGEIAVRIIRACPSAIRAARSEAASAFGNADIYIERRIEHPRHIEVQLLGDEAGTILPFVERECSIQRRHQKVIEESPSMYVSPALRRALARAAATVAGRNGEPFLTPTPEDEEVAAIAAALHLFERPQSTSAWRKPRDATNGTRTCAVGRSRCESSAAGGSAGRE